MLPNVAFTRIFSFVLRTCYKRRLLVGLDSRHHIAKEGGTVLTALIDGLYARQLAIKYMLPIEGIKILSYVLDLLLSL